MSDAERCVCCGEIVPEGQQICQNCGESMANSLTTAIKEKKEKDVVPVVRCRDCKYHHTPDCIAEAAGIKNVPGNWFCGDGARRKDV